MTTPACDLALAVGDALDLLRSGRTHDAARWLELLASRVERIVETAHARGYAAGRAAGYLDGHADGRALGLTEGARATPTRMELP